MEDKVHELGKMGIENFDLFSKFLKTITSDPHFFDSVNSPPQSGHLFFSNKSFLNLW